MMNLVTPYNTVKQSSAPFLPLNDFSGLSYVAVRNEVIRNYQIEASEMDKYQLLIASNVAHSDYEESSQFLLLEKATGTLCEVHGSHCSCYGYEGQFIPEATTANYLLSNRCGFFHTNEEARQWIKTHIGAAGI